MTAKEVLKVRENLFNELLEDYKEKAKDDPRYEKTYRRLLAGKEDFLKGRTLVQVIKKKVQL